MESEKSSEYEDDDVEEYEEDREKIEEYSFGNSDPKNDSGFISRLIFYWGYRIIKLASLTRLNLSDLGILNRDNSSVQYSKKIFEIWERYKNTKNALLKTVLRANLFNIVLVLVGSAISSGLSIYLVNLFNLFITEYTRKIPEQDSSAEKIKLEKLVTISCQYLGIKLFMVFFHRKLVEYQNEMGYKAGLQLDCLVYRKILNSSLTNEAHATIADIVNYIQVDSFKLTSTLIASPNVIIIPFLIIGYSYMLFSYFGYSFLVGFATLLIFVIINFCFQKELKDSQDLHHLHKDETMKMIIDTFNHIKAIKINGWDEEFLYRIQACKEQEIKSLGRRGFFSNVNQTCLWFAPVVISTVTIGLSQYYRQGIEIGDVFTCLKIFSHIDEPIRGLPGMLSNFFLTFVSLSRIQQYLLQDDFDTSYLVKDDEETKDEGIMIKIVNGTFTWGKSINLNARKESFITERNNSIMSEKIHNNNLNLNDSSLNDIDDKRDLKNNLLYGSESFDLSGNRSVDGFEICNFAHNAPVIKNIDLTILNGEFICILGETGSGKTSLLESILDNMIKLNEDSKVIINGSISYVGQVPWISNDTVKNNIIFHYPYNEERYKKVVELCKLEQDMEALIGGDSTEIGENGINISGGQKSRISLARGFYADKDIYIFDEPTSAIDARVGLSIIKKGLSTFLMGKTRILVTQTVEYAAFADRIIYMKEGEIIWEGKFEDFGAQSFAKNYKVNSRTTQIAIESSEKLKMRNSQVNTDFTRLSLANIPNQSMEETDPDDVTNAYFRTSFLNLSNSVIDTSGLITNEKIVVQKPEIIRTTQDEEVLRGGIQRSVIKKAIYYLGGYKLLAMLAFVVIQWQLSKNGAALWMFYWGDHQSQEYNLEYFIVYASFGIAGAILTFMKNKFIAANLATTSKNLHLDMVYHLVRAPLNSFHDITPKGQIINRLSRDINTVEDNFFQTYSSLVAFTTAFIYGIIMCSIYQQFCLILIPMLGIIGSLLTRFYLNCSRDLVRLEGNSRSPVLNTVNETCLGSNTIRAHNYNNVYTSLFYQRLDNMFKVRLSLIGTFQWYGLMLDFLSYFFEVFLVVFSLAFMGYYSKNLDVIALLLNYSTSLDDTLNGFLVDISNFQNTMISMERCLKYSEIVKEAPSSTPFDSSLKQWPSKGKINFNKFTVRYRPETDIRLNKISFEIKPGEKVGIVGRTGSGKSTIALSIGRLIEALSGRITIDDVDIKKVGLKKLRNSLNVISQDLSLLEGTLRYNIDPLGKYTDKEIKNAMKKLNFWYICEQSTDGLDQVVTESGMNFSMSEKQLIYATRALLNKAKIVILDEFTSNLDYKTEDLVNKVLFQHFKNSTIIVIAHRIKTVMKCDKVLVLNKGKVAEFDSPHVLKNKKESAFYKLYQKSYLDSTAV